MPIQVIQNVVIIIVCLKMLFLVIAYLYNSFYLLKWNIIVNSEKNQLRIQVGATESKSQKL